MKLVIDIDDSYKEYIDKIPYVVNYLRAGVDFHKSILKALQNGTPLPKGHGRILVVSEDIIKKEQTFFDFSFQKWIDEVGLSNATIAIIDADKTKREVK